MPRLPDRFLNCSAFLYPTVDAAMRDVSSGGSGVIMVVRGTINKLVKHYYILTNAHVIAGGAPSVRITRHDNGQDEFIDKSVGDWVLSDTDDLATCRVESSDQHGEQRKYLGIYVDMFMDDKDIQKFNVGIGDEVFSIGRFFDADRLPKTTPVVRFGNIAMMPEKSFPTSRHGKHFEQPSYLVEMRSRTGFSGSPIFAFISPTEHRFEVTHWTMADAGRTHGPWFLGLQWGQMPIFGPDISPEEREVVNPHFGVRVQWVRFGLIA